MVFWEDADVLVTVSALLDCNSLAQLRRSVSFVSRTISSAESVAYVACMRGLVGVSFDTLEQIALAESLAELRTSIDFAFREVTLEPSALEPLRRFALVLKRHDTLRVSIEGHCGLEAPRGMGFDFTRERALSVKLALASMGVDEDRLSARGYSNSRPLAWRFGDRAGAVNRRVELYVTAHGLTVPARRPRSEYARPPAGREDELQGSASSDEDGDELSAGVQRRHILRLVRLADGAVEVHLTGGHALTEGAQQGHAVMRVDPTDDAGTIIANALAHGMPHHQLMSFIIELQRVIGLGDLGGLGTGARDDQEPRDGDDDDEDDDDDDDDDDDALTEAAEADAPAAWEERE